MVFNKLALDLDVLLENMNLLTFSQLEEFHIYSRQDRFTAWFEAYGDSEDEFEFDNHVSRLHRFFETEIRHTDRMNAFVRLRSLTLQLKYSFDCPESGRWERHKFYHEASMSPYSSKWDEWDDSFFDMVQSEGSAVELIDLLKLCFDMFGSTLEELSLKLSWESGIPDPIPVMDLSSVISLFPKLRSLTLSRFAIGTKRWDESSDKSYIDTLAWSCRVLEKVRIEADHNVRSYIIIRDSCGLTVKGPVDLYREELLLASTPGIWYDYDESTAHHHFDHS